MNQHKSKPEKKIDELDLLTTIYSYKKDHGYPPTANDLMILKSEFAPSLNRADTLRMNLKRHKGRTIRRITKDRPHRYQITRQGEKQIVRLVEAVLKKESIIQQLHLPVAQNILKLHKMHTIAQNFAESLDKKIMLMDLFYRAISP